MHAIPTLWGDLRPDAVTPLAVLRAQATALRTLSEGVLDARVESTEAAHELVHRLTVRAPALDRDLAVVHLMHRADAPYPVTVRPAPLETDAETEPTPRAGFAAALQQHLVDRTPREPRPSPLADDYPALLAELRTVLAAPALVRQLTALIALSNASR